MTPEAGGATLGSGIARPRWSGVVQHGATWRCGPQEWDREAAAEMDGEAAAELDGEAMVKRGSTTRSCMMVNIPPSHDDGSFCVSWIAHNCCYHELPR
uniref:Uncharacterized protein n=1 Tax=Arundo donax TaxID=35708 RepID=A0A0A8Y6Z2_ARUDO